MKLIKTKSGYDIKNYQGVTIATTSKENTTLLHIDLVQVGSLIDQLVINTGIKEISEQYSSMCEDVSGKIGKYLVKAVYQDGYLKSMKDNKDKRFTIEDMKREIRNAFIHGQGNQQQMEAGLEGDETETFTNYRLMSLDKQEWDVELEIEEVSFVVSGGLKPVGQFGGKGLQVHPINAPKTTNGFVNIISINNVPNS